MEEDFYSKIELAKTKKNLSEFTKFLNRDLAFQKFLEKETEFLNSEFESITYTQRLYHLFFNVKEIEKCPICSKNKVWVIKNSFSGKHKEVNYSSTCKAKECQKKYNQIRTEEAIFKKYGVVNISQTKQWKDKVESTSLKKYGTKYYNQTEEFKEKALKTNLEKRGVSHHLKTKESMDVLRKTNLERYGTEYVSQTEEFKEKTKKTNLEKYGVEHCLQNKEVVEKLKKTNLEKYGSEFVTSTQMFKDKSKDYYLEKYGVEHNSQVTEIIEKRNRRKYLYKNYILPSGKEVKIQGYENKCLDELFKKGYLEEDIIIDNKEIEKYIGKILFKYENKNKRYYPDIYIKSENKIIEVKSEYTYKVNEKLNLAKFKACLDNGLNFEFKIY